MNRSIAHSPRAPRDTSVRAEQAARTRERILEDAVELLADGALAELAIPLVALRAGGMAKGRKAQAKRARAKG